MSISMKLLAFSMLVFVLACGPAYSQHMPEINPAIIDPLVDTLKNSPSVESRTRAAKELAMIGPKAKRALPSLIAALDEAAPEVRLAAIIALGRVGVDSKESSKALFKAIDKSTDPETRAHAVDALVLTDPTNKRLHKILKTEMIAGKSARPRMSQDHEIYDRREWALYRVAAMGDNGEWAVPLVLDLAALSGKYLDTNHGLSLFEDCTRTLGTLEMNKPNIINALKKYKQGKGLRSGNRERLERAMVAADTALKQIISANEDARPRKEE